MSDKDKQTSINDQFQILLHKKMLHKTGSAKRQMKRYYTAQFKKTGVIPQPLRLVEKGIMDGRQCSGRPRVLSPEITRRFIEMVKASVDKEDKRFIFVTQKARKVKNYQCWLEEEFNDKLSLSALVRCVDREHLRGYLSQPDDAEATVSTYFNPVNVFELVQVDGCVFQFIKIKYPQNQWRKLQVIEFYDTGSRYLFCLSAYSSETNENAVAQFTQFLLSTPFPEQTIRIRPDQSQGFLNLKRPIKELNRQYSEPGLFYLDPDFASARSPKHKVHLETSHRALHNFEMRLIKHFADKVVKMEPGFIYKNNKKIAITVTYLDITLQAINDSELLEQYRREHNENPHRFSSAGKTQSWIPKEKLETALSQSKTIRFVPADIEALMRYGFDKKKATVSKAGLITYAKRQYVVVVGREKFNHLKSTPIKVSYYQEKLLIFEDKNDGVWLGEAMRQGPSLKPESIEKKAQARWQLNEVEHIAAFLEGKNFRVNLTVLIQKYHQGLTLVDAQKTYQQHQERYQQYPLKLPEDPYVVGTALFNAFMIDCERAQPGHNIAPYATFKGEDDAS